MSTDKNQTVHPVTDSVLIGHEGLTKREYFAAMAMQGYLASDRGPSGYRSEQEYYEHVTKKSVGFADSLINQLNQHQPK